MKESSFAKKQLFEVQVEDIWDETERVRPLIDVVDSDIELAGGNNRSEVSSGNK